MSFAMLRQFRMTIGRRIAALIILSFIGVVGITIVDSRELASSLNAQKQIELKHLTELALGIVKEEHAAEGRRCGCRRAEAVAGVGRDSPIRQQRLFLGQRHASAHGDASDEA